jgi:hypothetical protein
MRGMAVWVSIVGLWIVALIAVVGVLRLPKMMDIYVKDHYFVVPRFALVVVILAALVLRWSY